MKNIVILTLLLSTCIFSKAQETEKNPDFGIKFSGFVKNDFFFDSRQTVSAREGHFLLWPTAESPDANGDDINAKSSFNFLSLQSRISGKITGPDFLGAKTSGVIEGDFFAQANDNINLFRLRHAMIKLKWSKMEIITGQYWNPLFVTGCFPGTVSFNTGTPLQSFARNPQIRLTYTMGNVKILGAALAQRDYTSRGPAGVSSVYLRNSGIPDLHIQLQFDSKVFLGGIGVAYKTIVPRLSSTVTLSPGTSEVVINMADTSATVVNTPATTATYNVDEKVSGFTAIAFTKINLNPITIKAQARYGQNIADVLAISGFAIKEVTDATTGEQSYTPLSGFTGWGEISYKKDKIEAGIFGGAFMNMGTVEEMSDANNTVYGLGTNIVSLIRVSPRISYTNNKVRIAGELEYTKADYGSDFDINYKAGTTSSINNIRFLTSIYYFF